MKYGTREGGKQQSKMKNKEVMKSDITFIEAYNILKKSRKAVSRYIKKRPDNTGKNLKPAGKLRAKIQPG